MSRIASILGRFLRSTSELLFSFFWNGTPGLALCILLAIFYLLPVIADRVKVKKT